jgi:hypothetical protein
MTFLLPIIMTGRELHLATDKMKTKSCSCSVFQDIFLFPWLICSRDHGKKQRKHFCVELHFLILLKYLGTQGNGGSISQLKLRLGIGKGSVYNYLHWAVDAVLLTYSAFVSGLKQMRGRKFQTKSRNLNPFLNVLDLLMELI